MDHYSLRTEGNSSGSPQQQNKESNSTETTAVRLVLTQDSSALGRQNFSLSNTFNTSTQALAVLDQGDYSLLLQIQDSQSRDSLQSSLTAN